MWVYPPRRILAAVDFGDPSAAALHVAGGLAREFGATLTAVHAETFEAPPYFTPDQVRTIEQQRNQARREAGRYLERHASEEAGVPVTPVIVEGPASPGILATALDHDLIVMGTHGRRGPARWWAGSVADRIVREAGSPVLVVRSVETDATSVFGRVLLVSEDGAAARYARGLAERFGGTLTPSTAEALGGAVPDDATLVVLPQPETLRFSAPADRLLRECRRPLLFVPAI